MREALIDRAEGYRERMTRFLRDLIAIPSPSGEEGKVVARIGEEMAALGFDEVRTDRIGNIIGRIGKGSRILLFDSHVDTVGIGDPDAWPHDPFRGKVEGEIVFGRGASDNKGGVAAMVYGGRLIRDLALDGGFTILVVGSVMEEDCDGLCYKSLIEEEKVRPDFVVLGEATGLRIYRGHRGRVEMRVETRGRSCHASAPERGKNAVYRMAPIVQGIERLGPKLRTDRFLGKGSAAVTHIDCRTPSLNAVPDRASIVIDRRLTAGETKASALREVRRIAGKEGKVEILEYRKPSHTGHVLPMEKYFPSWVLPADHALVLAGADAYRTLVRRKPAIGRWTFSTNGTYTMGIAGIPTIGLGPSEERFAHSILDRCPINHLTAAAAFYAALPRALRARLEGAERK
ncbi:MAG: YgeY family selenium metabolism-linked hydrolase [Candidatus Eisenbacteria bacterium]|nr:YgeY family selenium metabolism-linked hydrolase [Candidatus Eisenbacteria bacterium]